MNTIPAPKSPLLAHEEWPDADFDLPDDQPLHTACKDDGDEDWDLEMDLGSTGGAKATALVTGMAARSSPSQLITIRPPLSHLDDDEDEGVSTIKFIALPKPVLTPPTSIEDVESAFALPSDLSQLSLAPLPLNHRASKNSLEWGDKDHTSSSQSSDAYSYLGFADASPSSNSASSASSICTPDPETEEEEEDGELDGLIIPSGLFESCQGARKLTKILEMKKKNVQTGDNNQVSAPDPDDDFETGLVIEDDLDLSPSRLLLNTQQQQKSRAFSRSKSAPIRSTSTRPASRLKGDHGAKSSNKSNCPPSSARQLQKLRLSTSPPLRPIHPSRSQTFQALSSSPPRRPLHTTQSQTFQTISSALPSPSPTTFLSPKPGSLRGQKSHSGLKPPTPPALQRKVTRKASLSSLIEANNNQASGSGLASAGSSSKHSRYETPTAASRAKTYKNPSTSRIHAPEHAVPPARPSTPSSNPTALRLTMPTASRHKARPSLSAVFATSNSQTVRATSPPPPRPPSSLSLRTTRGMRSPSITQLSPPNVLRKPKKARMYGDGTELDGIDDLPIDRDKEGRYRVQSKGYGNRVPGASYSSKQTDKGTLHRKGRREGSNGIVDPTIALGTTTHSLKRTGRIEFPPTGTCSDNPLKKKKNVSSPSAPGQTRRKPTLIRNLCGASAAKVVGDMKWNPHTLRWEGNDQVLRDFDSAVGTSTRPALITHLTGSSIGSPIGSFASGARKVGNMIFDPTHMCWISTLPSDEDEPDVFANLADDEDDTASWEVKGGTIRAGPSDSTSSSSSEPPSPARCRRRSMSEAGSERGSRASIVCDVDDVFLETCRVAEVRHRVEMKGWKMRMSTPEDLHAEPERSYLYEIRALATRKY